MRRAATYALVLALSLTGLPLHAERLGDRVALEGARYASRLQLGDRTVDLSQYAFAEVERRLGDLVLIFLATGGTACPGRFVWVHVTTGDERMTEPFGTCSDLAEVTWDSETVTVIMPSMRADAPGKVAFVYDGKSAVREVQTGPATIATGPDTGVAALVGTYPGDLVASSEWEAALTALVGAGRIDDARRMLAVSGPMQAEGDWVTGQGCMQHNCGRAFGALAIHRGDGRMVMALQDRDGPPQLFGQIDGAVPQAIRAVLGAR